MSEANASGASAVDRPSPAGEVQQQRPGGIKASAIIAYVMAVGLLGSAAFNFLMGMIYAKHAGQKGRTASGVVTDYPPAGLAYALAAVLLMLAPLLVWAGRTTWTGKNTKNLFYLVVAVLIVDAVAILVFKTFMGAAFIVLAAIVIYLLRQQSSRDFVQSRGGTSI
jgi:MFS family permease